MRKSWLKNLKSTSSFMLAFVAISLAALLSLVLLLFWLSPLEETMPFISDTPTSVEDLDLQWINKFQGWAELLDQDGRVIQDYGDVKESRSAYTFKDLHLITENSDSTYRRILYQLEDEHLLLISLPRDVVTVNYTFELAKTMSDSRATYILIAWVLVYFLLVFLLVRRLQKKIAKWLANEQKLEQEERMAIFRGLAHDIKTPLSAMMAYTKALSDQVVPDEEKSEFLNSVYDQGKILRTRVDNLLEISSLDAATNSLVLVAEDVLFLSRENLIANRIFAKQNNCTLTIDASLNSVYIAYVDSQMWKRCIENIISNAIKHNVKGCRIDASWNPDKKSLVIQDNGVGIPNELLQKVKAPFIKGDASRSNLNLSGIGLYITDLMLKQMGWRLDLMNRPEGGLRVSFTQVD